MKIIHCADLHLDSRLQTHLTREKAKLRRNELLRNFERLADYASENGVEAILIAGDLFDRDQVSALTANMVLAVIAAHPRIRFYYLRGNHDKGDCLGQESAGKTGESGLQEKKDLALGNLFRFGSRWKTYAEGEHGAIAIAGIELTRENSASAHAALRLDPGRFNIVMLHGQTEERLAQEAAGGAADRAGAFADSSPSAYDSGRRYAGYGKGEGAAPVSLRALRGRGIDYLALGHIHSHREEKLDGRGICSYSGCLEGRGFDESGEHGFVLLEIDERKRTLLKHRFIPFAGRTLYALKVDVSGCRTTAEMTERVKESIRQAGCRNKDMADVTLTGQLEVDCEKDTAYIAASLSGSFFFARLRDRTSLRIDLDTYLRDESLRGEFVRRVLADDAVPEEEKNEVIRIGFMAMGGEDPE